MRVIALRRFGMSILCAAACLAFVAPAWAATMWTVNAIGEPAGGLGSSVCAATCTLRDAINAAQSGDTIMFAPVLDGQTIRLSLYTNCLTTSDTLDSSTNAAGNPCLPPATWPGYVTQFGPSAFFISGKSLTIDAAAGLSQEIGRASCRERV